MTVAVVTGGGRGIGRAIAIELARRGCDVAVLGRDQGGLAESRNAVEAEGRRALVVQCDVRVAAEVHRARDRIIDALGCPGVVIANAGVVHRVGLLEMTEAQWDEVLDVNLKGTFLTAQTFLPPMLAARRGRVIAIGSISGTMGTPRLTAYCASKWGTTGFVKALAEELRGTGLQVMSVVPGSVDTDMLKGSGFEPAMQPSDVAKIVAWAALDAPDAMNGSCVDAFGP